MSFATYPSLVDKSVFITGGATGIGSAMVRAFAYQGARVGFIDIDDDAARALIDEVGAKAKHSLFYRTVDVRDVDTLQNAIRDFAGQASQLDALINNVANDTRHQPLEITEEYWRNCMAVNLDSAFFASQTAIDLMRSSDGGSIINFSSINAIIGPTDMPGYVTAKSALLGLTKALARHYGPDRIRVNCILPGWVVTERQLDKWLTPEAEAEWREQTALKDRIKPEDVAQLALFLAADDSRMITNQQFIIDGGRV